MIYEENTIIWVVRRVGKTVGPSKNLDEENALVQQQYERERLERETLKRERLERENALVKEKDESLGWLMNRSDLVSLKDPLERPMRLLAIGKCSGRDTSTSAMWLLLIHYLDGKGIRAISCLYLLKDIMQAIAPNSDPRDRPKPCEYFDFISGTSSGGCSLLCSDVFECRSWNALTREGNI